MKKSRYYCEIVSDSLGHISPSVGMLLEELEKLGKRPSTVLDVGCGNGRNSLAIAKKYGSQVNIVDRDESMLEWARTNFAQERVSEIG